MPNASGVTFNLFMDSCSNVSREPEVPGGPTTSIIALIIRVGQNLKWVTNREGQQLLKLKAAA